MKATVFSHELLIGTTNLQLGDESMGCVYGAFLPTENYFREVQKSVWEFWKTNKPDYEKWNALRLNVQLDNGCFLYAAGGFTFDDLPHLSEEPIRIDIAGLDRYVIENFFLQNQPEPFLEEPWEAISIGQKLGFENELNKELGLINNGISFGDFFKTNQDKHLLADFDLFALGKDQRNDDVLFVTRNKGWEAQFAVVHLTWKGKKELKGYPATQFYKDFEDFKHSRMYPDKGDW